MIAAIKGNTDWKSANTEVIHTCDNVNPPVSHVYLHGSKIAEVGDDFLKLFDGGRQSMTTKSRLNALLSEFGYTCGTKQEYIFQKQCEWFIQMFDLTEKAMRTIPFTNGMRLAGWHLEGINPPLFLYTFFFSKWPAMFSFRSSARVLRVAKFSEFLTLLFWGIVMTNLVSVLVTSQPSPPSTSNPVATLAQP